MCARYFYFDFLLFISEDQLFNGGMSYDYKAFLGGRGYYLLYMFSPFQTGQFVMCRCLLFSMAKSLF